MAKAAEQSRKNLGDFIQLGAYVGYLILTYEFLVISQVSNLIFMSFGGAAARVTGCGNSTFGNVTAKEGCALLKAYNNTCDPVLKADFESVNYEFQYVCDSAPTVKSSTMFQMIGIIFGAMVFGQLSDLYGRKKTLIFGTCGLIIFGFLSTFMTNIYTFSAVRFFVMFFTGGKHSVSAVFMTENLPAKYRLAILTLVTYSPNYLVFSGMAYITGEWRLLSRLAAGVTFIPLVMLIFVKESPRWLMQKGRLDEAREAVMSIGRWDRSNTPDKVEDLDAVIDKERTKLREAEALQQAKPTYTLFHLFSSRALGIYSCFFACSLLITSVISYGITLNTEKLAGSLYVNIVVLGSFRYAINVFATIVDVSFKWVGRRLLHGVSMASVSGCLGTVFLIYIIGLEESCVGAVRWLTLLASAICTEIYILNAVQPSELFPTPIRNIGIGFIQIFNRIGQALSPQVFLLGNLWTPLPFLVMCSLSLAEVIAYLGLIPETKGKPMIEHMPGEAKASVENGAVAQVTNGEAEEKQSLKNE